MKLVRRWLTTVSTGGELRLDDKVLCYTLERPVGLNRPNLDAIPYGAYSVVLAWSPHFGMFLPKLLNVPGRTNILLHKGNTAEDTEGCILLGSDLVPNRLLGSATAFNSVMPKLEFPFTLTIEATK